LTALIKSGGKVVWFGTKPDTSTVYGYLTLAWYLTTPLYLNHSLLLYTLNSHTAFTCKINYLTAYLEVQLYN